MQEVIIIQKRLIDATEFKQIESLLKTKAIKNSKEAMFLFEQFMYDIDRMPTVDAVEVIRCKDCKHTIYSKVNPEVLICTLTKKIGTTNPTWFCADGEFKEDE